MIDQRVSTFFLVVSFLVGALDASAGDADPLYRACVDECQRTGCVGETCFTNCKFSLDASSPDRPWYMQEPLYLKWKQWDCVSDCRYHCMINREKERVLLNQGPVKYHGKWPFKRLSGFQEPVSVAFSALNLAAHFHGWLSFFIFLYYKLPLKPNKKPHYEFSGLWHIYALLSWNSWFWSAVFHSRYSAAGSPQKTSTAGSPTKMQHLGQGSLSSWYPSSQQSSAANSPPHGRALPARTPRMDGKEFFRQARSRLTYEQFSAFLANIKELNAQKQSREDTLRKAEEIFGTENKDLYISFQGLLNRNVQ